MNPSHTIFVPLSGEALKVAYTGTAGTTANLPEKTTAAWIVTTTDAFVRAGGTAVADQDLYVPAYTPVIIKCGAAPISAVQVSTGGTLYVTPLE